MKWNEIPTLDPNKDNRIIAMIPYKDMVLVALPSSLYLIKDGKIEEAEFE